MGGLRYHVIRIARMKLAHRDNGCFNRPDVSCHNCLQVCHHLRSDQDRIHARFRPCAMRAVALNSDIPGRCTCHHRACLHVEVPNRKFWPIVHAKNAVTRETVEQSVCDHRQRATQALFSRLKDEVHRSVKALACSKILCRTKQHGGVAVVPAGMHEPTPFGSMGELIQFKNR